MARSWPASSPTLRPGLPVIFMSGHPDRETLERLANDGYPFIQKPFTGEELTRFIDRVLDARST